jgi:hypothetical protein
MICSGISSLSTRAPRSDWKEKQEQRRS